MYACVGGWCDLRSVTQATCSHVGGWCELRTVTQATCTRVRGWWVLRNVTQTTCTHMGGWCVLRTGIATFSALSSTYSLGASHLWITGNSSSGWGVYNLSFGYFVFLKQNNFIYSMKISHIQSMYFLSQPPSITPHPTPSASPPLPTQLSPNFLFFFLLFSPKVF